MLYKFTFDICYADTDVCFAVVQISCNDNANTEPGRCNPLVGTSSVDSSTLDNREISETLDEFARLLSDYGCDDAVTTTPSPAQARLESLFVPPGNPSPAARLTDDATEAIDSAKDNPGPSVTAAEDEKSIE